jgi:hypothetical protein
MIRYLILVVVTLTLAAWTGRASHSRPSALATRTSRS